MEERSESTSSSPNKCTGKSMKGWLGNIMFQDLNGENSKEIGRITSKKIVGRKRIFYLFNSKIYFFRIREKLIGVEWWSKYLMMNSTPDQQWEKDETQILVFNDEFDSRTTVGKR